MRPDGVKLFWQRTVPMLLSSTVNKKLCEKKQPDGAFVKNKVTKMLWKSYARKRNSNVHQ
jgi:hypothetical protein